MAKSKEKIEARNRRREGKSVKEIAKSLNVSAASVSTWVRDILLTKRQIKNLKKRSTDPFYGKKLAYLQMQQKKFDQKVLKLKEDGKHEVGVLSKREVFLIGIALYWGEGFKKDRQVGLATLDPNIARLYLYWLQLCFGIQIDHLILRVTANISYQKKVKQLEQFWSKILKVPLKSFSKPYFQKTAWKKIYENPQDYHGVIRIKVRRSVNLLRKIQGNIDGISQNVKLDQ